MLVWAGKIFTKYANCYAFLDIFSGKDCHIDPQLLIMMIADLIAEKPIVM